MRLKYLLGEKEKPILALEVLMTLCPMCFTKEKSREDSALGECLTHLAESQFPFTQLLCALRFWNIMATNLTSMYTHLSKKTMVYLESTEFLNFHCVLSPPFPWFTLFNTFSGSLKSAVLDLGVMTPMGFELPSIGVA